MFSFLSSIHLHLKAKKKNLGIFWYSNTGLKWTDWASDSVRQVARIVIPLYPAVV